MGTVSDYSSRLESTARPRKGKIGKVNNSALNPLSMTVTSTKDNCYYSLKVANHMGWGSVARPS